MSEDVISSKNGRHIILEHKKGVLKTHHFNSYDSESVEDAIPRMVRDVIAKFNITRDFKLEICTEDVENTDFEYNMSTSTENYDGVYPHWTYQSWLAVGIDDAEQIVKSFENTTPEYPGVAGWIGNPYTNINRQILMQCSRNSSYVEAISNIWAGGGPIRERAARTPTYLSLKEQIQRWEYLIDIEGYGYSARLPIFLQSPRIVFVQDRPHKEWWWPHFKPWVHYVPVKRNMSDFPVHFNRLHNDKQLQEYIKLNQRVFAAKYLTREAQHCRIADIILKHIK